MFGDNAFEPVLFAGCEQAAGVGEEIRVAQHLGIGVGEEFGKLFLACKQRLRAQVPALSARRSKQ